MTCEGSWERGNIERASDALALGGESATYKTELSLGGTSTRAQTGSVTDVLLLDSTEVTVTRGRALLREDLDIDTLRDRLR